MSREAPGWMRMRFSRRGVIGPQVGQGEAVGDRLEIEGLGHGEIIFDGVAGRVIDRARAAQHRLVGHPAGIPGPARPIAKEAAHAATPEEGNQIGLGHVGEKRDAVRLGLELFLQAAPAIFAAHVKDAMQAGIGLVKLDVRGLDQQRDALRAEVLRQGLMSGVVSSESPSAVVATTRTFSPALKASRVSGSDQVLMRPTAWPS